eukprot:CAMPEP_0183769980 /NCGR_PEP_ID=MMETSP0739-20130205/24767_1 /TAXON_ID=385413 /ORGANISM="Thalassiosira miniscula, Strain CCMP1093" /LENGTH=216 /DNA_ID=CAMNT_0026009771 /DNA_START=9 /DNA_END=659 /DNA_ORIENTATION=-
MTSPTFFISSLDEDDIDIDLSTDSTTERLMSQEMEDVYDFDEEVLRRCIGVVDEDTDMIHPSRRCRDGCPTHVTLWRRTETKEFYEGIAAELYEVCPGIGAKLKVRGQEFLIHVEEVTDLDEEEVQEPPHSDANKDTHRLQRHTFPKMKGERNLMKPRAPDSFRTEKNASHVRSVQEDEETNRILSAKKMRFRLSRLKNGLDRIRQRGQVRSNTIL